MDAAHEQLPVTLEGERAALERARAAAATRITELEGIKGGGADEYTDQYIAAMVNSAVGTLRRELVVFGRIDDAEPWRIGLYGIDADHEQLVVDWRAPFAEGFYQATRDDPKGLRQRVSYVGCIDELMVEDFVTGGISGSSPLIAELSRQRGPAMRAAVATLQAEQDRLVRLGPAERLVLRGGPGTGKTVVALHRAAWILYNDRRLSSDRLLVVGPSDRFLRYVATVLPTLGEARIAQTTFERLFGPATVLGTDERWLALLDAFEAWLPRPERVRARGRAIPVDEVEELVAEAGELALPWRDRRRSFLGMVASRLGIDQAEAGRAAGAVMPAVSAKAAWARFRSRATLEALGADDDLLDAGRAIAHDGPLFDELRARIEGTPALYSHVIVDEAQDMTMLQFRAVQRRATGLTLVGDDAQRSVPGALGLRRIAALLDTPVEEMATAYRMSAEIAAWLNAHAAASGLEAVALVGIRPNGIEVGHHADAAAAAADLRRTWGSVAVITHDDVWVHKGVEYDAVVAVTGGMAPAEVYLAASRAAHQLVLVP